MNRFLLLLGSLAAAGLLTSCNEGVAQAQTQTTQSLSLDVAASSVVRVNCTNQSYNFIRPWEKGNSIIREGLGAVLEGNRVLVTAEMVADNTYLELEKADTGEKATAKVVGVDYEVNLALLEPEEEFAGFLEGMKPLELDNSVVAGDEVEVWQLESNGTPASTSGTILKAAVSRYFVDGSYFLTYLMRGSLQYREGSFTLPVIKNSRLVGLLLSYSSKEQTSDIIPAPLIEHFLADLEDGEYAGFPNLGLSYSSTLDDQLRKYTKIENYEGGVYVRRVSEDGPAMDGGMQTGDVILTMDGHAIDSRGNYDHPMYGKLNFSHIVRGDAENGDVIPVELVRDGEEMTVELTLTRKAPEEFLVDPYMYDRGPRFMIKGGLIFQELTLPYLKVWGDSWPTRAPFKLVHAHAHQEQYEEAGREKLVILSAVIRTPATLGYERINNVIVDEVNDVPINSITDLKSAFQSPTDGIHKIEIDDYPKVIYVDERMSEAINEQFGQALGIWELERLK